MAIDSVVEQVQINVHRPSNLFSPSMNGLSNIFRTINITNIARDHWLDNSISILQDCVRSGVQKLKHVAFHESIGHLELKTYYLTQLYFVKEQFPIAGGAGFILSGDEVELELECDLIVQFQIISHVKYIYSSQSDNCMLKRPQEAIQKQKIVPRNQIELSSSNGFIFLVRRSD